MVSFWSYSDVWRRFFWVAVCCDEIIVAVRSGKRLSLSLTHTRATWCLMCLIRATAHWGPGHSSNQIPRGEILAKHVAHGQVCVLSSVFLLLNMSWHVTAVMGMGMTLAWDMFRNIWWVPVESVKAQWWKRRGGPKLWLPWTKLRSVSLTKSDKC